MFCQTAAQSGAASVPDDLPAHLAPNPAVQLRETLGKLAKTVAPSDESRKRKKSTRQEGAAAAGGDVEMDEVEENDENLDNMLAEGDVVSLLAAK